MPMKTVQGFPYILTPCILSYADCSFLCWVRAFTLLQSSCLIGFILTSSGVSSDPEMLPSWSTPSVDSLFWYSLRCILEGVSEADPGSIHGDMNSQRKRSDPAHQEFPTAARLSTVRNLISMFTLPHKIPGSSTGWRHAHRHEYSLIDSRRGKTNSPLGRRTSKGCSDFQLSCMTWVM